MDNNWREGGENSSSDSERLVLYQKSRYDAKEPYLDQSLESKYYCMARINDELKVSGKISNTVCPVCEAELQPKSLMTHILIHCTLLEVREARNKADLRKIGTNESEIQWMRWALNCKNKDHIREVGTVLKIWHTKVKLILDNTNT